MRGSLDLVRLPFVVLKNIRSQVLRNGLELAPAARKEAHRVMPGIPAETRVSRGAWRSTEAESEVFRSSNQPYLER